LCIFSLGNGFHGHPYVIHFSANIIFFSYVYSMKYITLINAKTAHYFHQKYWLID
jgi:hypothetical protein